MPKSGNETRDKGGLVAASFLVTGSGDKTIPLFKALTASSVNFEYFSYAECALFVFAYCIKLEVGMTEEQGKAIAVFSPNPPAL